MYQSLDTILYAHREDRNLILMGGGTVTWDATAGTLAWSSNFIIFSPHTGYHETISTAYSPLTVSDGSLVYVDLVRNPSGATAIVPYVSNTVPQSDNALLVLLRNGSDLYWRNGLVMQDGFSGTFQKATFFKDYIWLPVTEAADMASPPAAAVSLTDAAGSAVVIRNFDDVAAEAICFSYQLPADVIVAEKLRGRVVCAISNAIGPSGEGVMFDVDAACAGDGDSMSPVMTGGISGQAGMTLSQYDIFFGFYCAAFTPTNYTAGETLILEIARNPTHPADTYGQDVGLIGVELEIYRGVS
jgi:hypothetical protein